MNEYRVIVTGSRSWNNPTPIRDALNELASLTNYVGLALVLVHGACPQGADQIAHEWAARHSIRVQRFPADWRLGKGAGPARNRDMVEAGAHLCLAFYRLCSAPQCVYPNPHATHGTYDCMKRAELAGIEVRRYPWAEPIR